jgi:hypothetical protein
MAASLTTLQARAATLAQRQGHTMSEWFPSEMREGRAFARCLTKTCIAELVVTAKPAANEVDILGTAVALECPYPGERRF